MSSCMVFLTFFDTLLHDVIKKCRSNDVFWKSVFKCTFDMHDEPVMQERNI